MVKKMNEAPTMPAPDKLFRASLAGYAVIFLAFGVVGGWAATMPLGSAAIGMGVIAAETNRKTVQHFEGGFIATINVREGQHVAAGDVLFQLDQVQTRANLDIQQNQLASLLAQEARLVAEQEGQAEIVFPAEFDQHNGIVARAIRDQSRQFADRRASLEGQAGLLRSRILTLRTEIQGLDREEVGKRQQISILIDEITGLRSLFSKGLTPKQRLLQLEREMASLEGQVGRSIADRAKAENGINEAELQIQQLRQQFSEQVVKDLIEARSKIADLRERVIVAQDVLRRLVIIAPTTGTVQSLKVFTVGAVVRPGDSLLDIVPDNDELIIQAQFTPADVDSVRPGAPAEVRFPSIPNRALPVVMAQIRSISRDRLIDEGSKQPFFLAILSIDQRSLPVELQGRLSAGMPAEVLVPVTERTAFQYLVEPLTNVVRKTMRER